MPPLFSPTVPVSGCARAIAPCAPYAGVRAEPLRVRHETLFPAAVLAEGEGPRQDVVAGRDPAKNRFGVTDPLAGVGRPGFEPGRQIANQYVILARTLFFLAS